MVYVRQNEFKQRVDTESLDIDKKNLDREATPSARKTRVLPGRSDPVPRKLSSKEYRHKDYETRAQQDPADIDTVDKSADARFKEHLFRLFNLGPLVGSQDGESATNSALQTHAQDTEYNQNKDLLSPNEEKTTTSLAKISKHSHPEDQGAYAERGLPYISQEWMNKEDSGLTSAMNARVGYRFNENLALEIDFDYIPGVPGYDLVINSDAQTYSDKSDLDVTTYMPAVKFSPDLGSKTVRPYIIGGFGLMHADTASEKYNPPIWFVDPKNDSVLETSSKIGLGFDFRKDNTSLGIQGSLASGSGDLANFVYQSWSMGLTLHW